MSFVRSHTDVAAPKSRIEAAGSQAWVIAKIELKEAVTALDSILDVADAVMIARGDLGVEIVAAKVPLLQKKIILSPIERGNSGNHAPQMPEAMVQAKQLFTLGESNNNNNVMLAAAGFLRQVFDSLRNKDSAYYYARLEATINARIFSQNNINKIQALSFNEQIRLIEVEAKKAEEEQRRKQNIQYALLALGIITFIILFLLLSRRHITNTKLIQFLGVVALLLVFEFLNLLLHPFLERVTNHSPLLMLLALVCIAALLVPLHHKLEKWATQKLVEKNKQIRLASAKKTIERLEKS